MFRVAIRLRGAPTLPLHPPELADARACVELWSRVLEQSPPVRYLLLFILADANIFQF